VLLEAWVQQLEQVYAGPIGIVGDGAHHVEDITVMTFESAYRHLDRWGGRFGMLVVDEAHHFGSGVRTEALEMCAAPMRMGLTATAPAEKTPAYARLAELLGRTVFEMSLDALVGTHLAPLEIVHVRVSLEDDEWTDYAQWYGPFAELRAAYARAYPDSEWADCVRAITKTERGRKAYADYNRAIALAAFPREKQRRVASLIERHRTDKTLVFSGLVEHAYRISEECLVPIITAEVGRQERESVLSRFGKGDVRCIVSARVLNEGVDVPDANVAIVVSGMLGEREHVQRIGRVLRPAEGKRALVYELSTRSTIDEKRAQNRRRTLAAQRATRNLIERAAG
jgi:superfamily II DNA or RNA helicase